MNFNGSSELLTSTRVAIVAEGFELSRYPQWDNPRPLGLRPVCGLVKVQSLGKKKSDRIGWQNRSCSTD